MGVSLVLASGSPRRFELLRRLGLTFDVMPADIDETERPGEAPAEYVGRVAHDKVLAVVAALGSPAATCVLGADTTVDVDGAILAKPDHDADARRMLTMLSGRTHQVHTGVAAWHAGHVESVVVTTDVTFAALDPAQIDWYLALGEHTDKAGAYGMQGAGGALVTRIDGSPSNVIGLPMAETVAILRSVGAVG
jgi:septum formation protein